MVLKAARAESERLMEQVPLLGGQKIVVIGDLIADHYVYGLTSRVSREAPVLIVRRTHEEWRLGGAANAAMNVRSLGGEVSLIGVLGRDLAGDQMQQQLSRAQVRTFITHNPNGPTTVKMRVLAGSLHAAQQQVLRLDHENKETLCGEHEAEILKALHDAAANADAVLVSDYGLGTLSSKMIDALKTMAARGQIVCVDSRFGLLRYQGVTAATPNELEAEAALNGAIESDEDVLTAGTELLHKLRMPILLVTRGQKGMALFEHASQPRLFPIAGSREVTDVTGAGDTVIAALTLALAARLTPFDAARLANYAAGISVTKAGAATVNQAELLQAMRLYEVPI